MELSFEPISDTRRPKKRAERIIKNWAKIVMGSVLFAGAGVGIVEGKNILEQLERQHQAKKELLRKPVTDEEQVRRLVAASKYRDINTGETRRLPRLNGVVAVRNHLYSHPKDGSQYATNTNIVLVRIDEDSTYIYGEDAMSEPVIWNINEATLCKPAGVEIIVEDIELGHDLVGGIAVPNTGMFLANDQNWQQKCQEPVDLKALNIHVASYRSP